MKRVLFVCSRNRLRSPTAENLFAERQDIEVASAGLDHDAEQPLTPSLLEWADVIFVMEQTHLKRLRKRFGQYLNRQRVVCLNIPDDYTLMDPALIEILNARVPRHLGLNM